MKKRNRGRINVNVLDMIRYGRFGSVEIGSTLDEVAEFFKPLSGIEPQSLPLVSSDESLEGVCAFVTGGIRIYLHKKYNDEFRVTAIIAEALKKGAGFIDEENCIYFDCCNMRRGKSISKIKRKLERMGIGVENQELCAYSVLLYTIPYGMIVFNFYPPEGVFEETAKLIHFQII